MAQALQAAQARLDQLQRRGDEVFRAYEASPSDLKKERYKGIITSQDRGLVNNLAAAIASQVGRLTVLYFIAYASVISLCTTAWSMQQSNTFI